MNTATAGQWVKFFNTAGVPSPAAATYAHIFVENRIQTDMLMDLNKEYLREMGISLMGDIIAILRHAKQVNEQTARDKVLASEVRVPVAAVPANTASQTGNSSNTSRKVHLASSDGRTKISSRDKLDSTDTEYEVAIPKQPRRVLPEHEGRYKITLPSGTTQRSKEILAKKAMLYADRETKKVGVFERLSTSDYESEDRPKKFLRVVDIDKTVSSTSSIFSRLGGRDSGSSSSYSSITSKITPTFGILKTTSKSHLGGVSRKSLKQQSNIMVVRKIPAKAATMVADEYEQSRHRMETGEKTVSFSSEDEVLEIAPRKVIPNQRGHPNKNVKYRLGMKGPRNVDTIRKTKKTIKLKPQSPKKTASPKSTSAILRMASDEIQRKKQKSIHSRLDLSSMKKNKNATKSNPVSNLANRIGRVSLSSAKMNQDTKNKSVFDRLGFGKTAKY